MENATSDSQKLHEFHLMEYAALRGQLTEQYNRTFNWVLYVVTANAVLAAWFINAENSIGSNTSIRYVIAFLPLLISILGNIIIYISYRSISASIDYFKKIDQKYGGDVGFSKFYDDRKTYRAISTRRIINIIFVIIHTLSIAFAIVIIT